MPLSLVLKEMHLLTATYEGSPAQPASVTRSSVGMHVATRSTSMPHAVDNTDWLKTAAIILVLVDHFGYFFMEDDRWWSVFGRLAAPTFFFLMGYAETRTVPLHWIGLGVILTLLDSWNADWTWVAPNILLSFAFIRIARPHVQRLVQRYGWAAFALLVCGLFAVLAAGGEDCRLRRGGVAVGVVRPLPASICRRQSSCRRWAAERKARPHPRRDDREPGPDAPRWPALSLRSSTSGRNKRNSRFLRSISPSSLLVSAFCPWPVSIPARTEPHPTARDHSRRCCALSAGTPWKFTLSSLPAPNSS